MPRPATGKTPVRNVRIGDEIWEQVERAAHEDGTTATAIVKEALLEYVAKRAKQRARARKTSPAGDPDPE